MRCLNSLLFHVKDRNMPFEQVHIDDLLITSPDLISHKQHMRAVLRRLDEDGVNTRQNMFLVSKLCTVSPKGNIAIEEEMDTIRQYIISSSLIRLRRVQGLVNFYSRFILSHT